jgi:hypothetical protein
MSAVAAQAAQAQDAPTRDDKEIYNYRLTVDKARAVAKANDEMLALLKADPAFAASVKKLTDAQEQAQEEGKSDSLSDIEAVIAQEPKLTKAIQNAGLSPREYVRAELALIAGTMGAAIKKAGAEVPKEFNPEHIAFAEKNSAELTQILATLDQINKLLDGEK